MRILLCDDDTALVESFSFLLRQRGHRVRAVTDPAAMLATATSGTVDVCVVDLQLSGGDADGPAGFGLVGQLRTAAPGCRILVLTGSDDPRDRRRALDAGADAFVVKGTDIRGLIDQIEADR